MKLSVITIVLNEEEILPKWFEHHKDFFKEVDLVLVDGGSTDRTVEIIKEHGFEPYFREWDHNFSNQRNFAIEQAKFDWCFILDTDEFLSNEIKEALPEIIQVVDVPVLVVHRYNYIDGEKFDPFEEQTIRLFKKSFGVRYRNKVHEIPIVPLGVPYRLLSKNFYFIHDKPNNRARNRWKYYHKQFGIKLPWEK